MLTATVVGNVWSTRRLAEIPNGAFLEVEAEGTGTRLVAFDVLGSGVGERVLVAHRYLFPVRRKRGTGSPQSRRERGYLSGNHRARQGAAAGKRPPQPPAAARSSPGRAARPKRDPDRHEHHEQS